KQPCIEVALNRRWAEHLGQTALACALPHLHLEKPVLGHHKALRKKEIVLILGVNVRNAPAISNHFDWLFKPGRDQIAVNRRKRLACPDIHRLRRLLCRGHNYKSNYEEGTEQENTDS